MTNLRDILIEKVAESLKSFITSELKIRSTDILLTNYEITTVFNPEKTDIKKIKGCFLIEGESKLKPQLKIESIVDLPVSFPKVAVYNLNRRLSRKKIVCIIDFNKYSENKEFLGRIFIGDAFEEYILKVIEFEEKNRWENWIEEIFKKY